MCMFRSPCQSTVHTCYLEEFHFVSFTFSVHLLSSFPFLLLPFSLWLAFKQVIWNERLGKWNGLLMGRFWVSLMLMSCTYFILPNDILRRKLGEANYDHIYLIWKKLSNLGKTCSTVISVEKVGKELWATSKGFQPGTWFTCYITED